MLTMSGCAAKISIDRRARPHAARFLECLAFGFDRGVTADHVDAASTVRPRCWRRPASRPRWKRRHIPRPMSAAVTPGHELDEVPLSDAPRDTALFARRPSTSSRCFGARRSAWPDRSDIARREFAIRLDVLDDEERWTEDAAFDVTLTDAVIVDFSGCLFRHPNRLDHRLEFVRAPARTPRPARRATATA